MSINHSMFWLFKFKPRIHECLVIHLFFSYLSFGLQIFIAHMRTPCNYNIHCYLYKWQVLKCAVICDMNTNNIVSTGKKSGTAFFFVCDSDAYRWHRAHNSCISYLELCWNLMRFETISSVLSYSAKHAQIPHQSNT